MNHLKLRTLLLAWCCILTLQAGAQELKKVIKSTSAQREEFYVLKSDNAVRQGPYKKYSYKYHSVVETGFYKNNLKDSTWTDYYPGTKYFLTEGKYKNGQKEGYWQERVWDKNTIYLKEKGEYKNGVRIGPWQKFNPEGEIIKVYDYSLNKLYFEKPVPDSMEAVVRTADGWFTRKLDKFPGMPEDSKLPLLRFIADNTLYPMDAARAGIEGTVIVTFLVNEAGMAEDFEIKTSVHPSLDAEALRVLKLAPFRFSPALLEGKPVTTRITFPLKFALGLAD